MRVSNALLPVFLPFRHSRECGSLDRLCSADSASDHLGIPASAGMTEDKGATAEEARGAVAGVATADELFSPRLTKLAAARLTEAGVEQPALDARLLLAHATGYDAGRLRLEKFPVTPEAAATYETLVARRAERVPVAKLTGRKEFWSLSFAVDSSTLDPRPDSETLIELLLALRPDRASVRRVLDLGVGTGCLLLSALSEYLSARGLGIDRSGEALAVARRNAETLGMAGRAEWREGDWCDGVEETFDVILCNPPYIAEGAALMPEVARHEPPTALYAGADGLDDYRRLLPQLRARLTPGGVAILEIGQGQAAAVARLAADAGLAHHTTRDDLAGVPRALAFTSQRQG